MTDDLQAIFLVFAEVQKPRITWLVGVHSTRQNAEQAIEDMREIGVTYHISEACLDDYSMDGFLDLVPESC